MSFVEVTYKREDDSGMVEQHADKKMQFAAWCWDALCRSLRAYKTDVLRVDGVAHAFAEFFDNMAEHDRRKQTVKLEMQCVDMDFQQALIHVMTQWGPEERKLPKFMSSQIASIKRAWFQSAGMQFLNGVRHSPKTRGVSSFS